MKHNVSRKMGIALDQAIQKYGVVNVLDASKENTGWSGDCSILNTISLYQLARYIIEGYTYAKTTEDAVQQFSEWVNTYDIHSPPPTKNSSFRRGKNMTLAAVKEELTKLGLMEEETAVPKKRYIILHGDVHKENRICFAEGQKYEVHRNGRSSGKNAFIRSDHESAIFLDDLPVAYNEVYE